MVSAAGTRSAQTRRRLRRAGKGLRNTMDTSGTSRQASTRIAEAFRRAAGRWTGCDWHTAFGETRLNLHGLKASQALLLARATAGIEAADWHAAAGWLTLIEREARQAEALARQAVRLSREGQLQQSLQMAHNACLLESPYHSVPIWQSLHAAIEAALTEAGSIDTRGNE